MTRRATTLLTGTVLLIVLILLAMWAPVKYVELVPGPTYNTLGATGGKDLITITGAPTTASTGQLRMLTVAERQGLNTYEVVQGWLRGTDAVVPEEIIDPPGQTQQQIDKANTDAFAASQSSAITAALRHAGYPVQVTVEGVTVGKPADGHLKVGDVITSVDGRTVLSSQDLVGFIQAKPAGTALKFGYTRGGVAGETPIVTVAGDGGHPQIGVSVDQKQPSPLTVKIELDNVGGPSAGLMFSLGIIDKLDPADLTGGRIIAGTGTIDDDGNVGPIGGIAQKMVGAYEAGARIFLAPADNCAEALQNQIKGLTLVKVASLDSALTALQQVRDGQQPQLCAK
jgi:PDZ domain-containing protein